LKTGSFTNALACTGAVIGAGFASGREIAAFFSRYGQHGWWLMAASSALMTGLCWLCMRETARSRAECWCELFKDEPFWLNAGIQLCTILLLMLTAGAMIAASGQMVALMWAHQHAYVLGAVGTLVLAWIMGRGGMRPLGWISGMLIGVFLATLIAGFTVPAQTAAPIDSKGSLVTAAVRAAGYAAMNMTLAIGVICRCAQPQKKQNQRTALWFGLMMFLMMGLSHRLYSAHPKWLNESFPLVRILSSFGRTGFLLSAALIYLSVFTSLTAVLYALKCAVGQHTQAPVIRIGLVVAVPVLVSCVGFAQIVDHLYAPAGLICLLAVFYPLFRRRGA